MKTLLYIAFFVVWLLGAESNEKLNELMLASKMGSLSKVEKLIKINKHPLDEQTNMGKTALMFALENHHKDVAILLIQSGANINLANKNGYTPLLYALNSGFELDMLRVFTQYDANYRQRTKEGLNALYIAINKLSSLEVFQYLLAQGVDVNNISSDGWSPLLLASLDITKEPYIAPLIARGAHVNHKSAEGWTALLLAIKNRFSLSTIEKLVVAGADTNIYNNEGISIETIAKNSGYDDIKAVFKAAKVKHQKELDELARQKELEILRKKYE